MSDMSRRDAIAAAAAFASTAIVAGCEPAATAAQARVVTLVDDFGTVGDGVTDDTRAFARACEHWQQRGGVLRLGQGRTYAIGPLDRSGDVFTLRDLHDAQLDGNGATLKVTTTGYKTRAFLFRFLGFRGLRIDDLTIACAGGNLDIDWQGVYAVTLDGTSEAYGRGVAIRGLVVRDAVAMLWSTGGIAKLSLLSVNDCLAERCYYGMVFAENGDAAVLDYAAINCRRAYFAYGVSHHVVQLRIAHTGETPGADACILIKRYDNDTTEIAVRARFDGPAFPWAHAGKLELEPTRGHPPGAIRNVALTLAMPTTVTPPTTMAALGIAALATDGGGFAADAITGIHLQLLGSRGWKAIIENDAPQLGPVTIDIKAAQEISLFTRDSTGAHTRLLQQRD